jgi:hypothetical protein
MRKVLSLSIDLMRRWLIVALAVALLGVTPAPAADFGRMNLGWPLIGSLFGSPLGQDFTFDGATDRIEWIVQAPEAVTITYACFRYDLRTGTPPTYKISIQGVNNSGDADGTIKGGASPASKEFTPPTDGTWDNTVQCKELLFPYTTTRGEFFAIVITYVSGTIDASNNSAFTPTFSNMPGPVASLPYAIQVDAGTPTRQSHAPVYGYQSATGTSYGFPLLSSTSTTFSLDSNPDEYALRFVLDAGNCATFKVVGVEAGITGPAANKQVLVQLYEGTTVLQNVQWDTDHNRIAGGNLGLRLYFDEATLSTLACGTVYRIGFQPMDSATSLAIRVLNFATHGDLGALPGGINWYLSTRVNTGSWDDTTTSRPLIAPIIEDVTKPTGGGGGPRIFCSC